MKASVKEKTRLSRDAITNLHELAYTMPDFNHNIVTYKDLHVACATKCVLADLDSALTLKHHRQLLSYHTTFHMGDLCFAIAIQTYCT